jgi:hypothetical protein
MALTKGLWTRYKLRMRRKRFLLRALRKRREIRAVARRTDAIRPGNILLFATLRNEMLRLPHFLQHYRRLGVSHFLIVDNGSDDGSDALLAAQPDVSLWSTTAGYKASRFGMDWLTCLLWRYGHGHWTVTVDADETLIYPDWERVDLPELTGMLERAGLEAMGSMMLDLYPKGRVQDQSYQPGQDPADVLQWFDAFGYWAQRQPKLDNLWLQGGARARFFFADDPRRAPTLNKIPLIRWQRGFVFVNSTHNALPIRLNHVYDEDGLRKPTGILLHSKFLPDAGLRARSEQARRQHFADPSLYEEYYDTLAENPDLWTESSERYLGAEQLERLGLMTRGDLAIDR